MLEELVKTLRTTGMKRLLTTILCLALSGGCMRVEERYGSPDAARQAGLFERGWLPDVLPHSGGQITELHNLDTNSRCSLSSLPASSLTEVEASLRDLGFAMHEGEPAQVPFRNCPFTSAEVLRASTVMSRSSSEQTEFAIVRESPGALLFWSVSLSHDGT